ncbi:MAG: hypothetical protein IKF36_03325 [Bacilli bacterium]|nr:hypothetical protein [Bacilli bacterium]
MLILYLLFNVVMLPFMINYLSKLNNNCNIKRYMIFISLDISLLLIIPIINAFLSLSSFEHKGLGDFIFSTFLYFVCLLSYLIIFFMGFIKRKKYIKKSNYRDNKIKKIKLVLLFISIMVGISSFYAGTLLLINQIKIQAKDDNRNYIKEKITNYLDDKFGKGNCLINSVSEDYYTESIGSRSKIEGYNATFVCNNKYKAYAYVNLEHYDSLKIDYIKTELIKSIIKTDNIDKEYYKDKIKEEIQKFSDYVNQSINMEIEENYIFIDNYDDEELIKDNYGKVPTFDEVYNLIYNHELKEKLVVKRDKYNSDVNEYLYKLSNIILDYYNNDLDYYKISYNNQYSIIIDKDYIHINKFNKEINKYKRN